MWPGLDVDEDGDFTLYAAHDNSQIHTSPADRLAQTSNAAYKTRTGAKLLKRQRRYRVSKPRYEARAELYDERIDFQELTSKTSFRANPNANLNARKMHGIERDPLFSLPSFLRELGKASSVAKIGNQSSQSEDNEDFGWPPQNSDKDSFNGDDNALNINKNSWRPTTAQQAPIKSLDLTIIPHLKLLGPLAGKTTAHRMMPKAIGAAMTMTSA